MVDSLKKFREIAAFVLLGVVAVHVLMGLISLIYYASSSVGYGFTGGAQASSSMFVSPVFVPLLTVVVGTCVLWERTKNARLLTLLSLIVVAGGLLLGFLLGVIGLASGGGGRTVIQFFTFLGSVAVVALAAFALYRMLLGQPAPVAQQHQQFGYGQLPGGYDPTQGYAPQPGQQVGGQPGQQNYPPQQPQQPAWQPDQASGASWQTADQAASGASASSWGNPGPNTGWDPAPGAPTSASGGPNEWQPQHVPQQPYSPTQPAQPGENVDDAQHQPSAQDPPASDQPGQPGQGQQNRDWWGPQQ